MSTVTDIRTRLQEATAGQMLTRLVAALRRLFGEAPPPPAQVLTIDEERRHAAAERVRRAIERGKEERT